MVDRQCHAQAQAHQFGDANDVSGQRRVKTAVPKEIRVQGGNIAAYWAGIWRRWVKLGWVTHCDHVNAHRRERGTRPPGRCTTSG